MPVWTHYFAHFVVVVIATISFGITFQMPRRHYLLRPDRRGGLDGLHLLRGAVRVKPGDCDAGRHAAADRLRAVLSIRHKAPVTIFLLPGIFPLVPGAGIYYTAYYFLQGEQELFASKGGETSRSLWPWRWALRWCAVCRCRAGMRESAIVGASSARLRT